VFARGGAFEMSDEGPPLGGQVLVMAHGASSAFDQDPRHRPRKRAIQ
jgi:hypothetical protein